MVILVFSFYFLPAIIARNKEHAGRIALLNLLFGWTFVGWIILLIWAVSNKE
ncbi:superinfection immunity protein [Candidatus Margulisiibacteriota bacterium]